MARSRNNKITKRGNHAQRLRTHDEYLTLKFPDQFNLTNPYTAPVLEMLEEEMKAAQEIEAPTLEGEIVEPYPYVFVNDVVSASDEVRALVQEVLLTGKIAGNQNMEDIKQ